MPIGLTRLNERHQRPNQNITFIKVNTGRPDHGIALDILERVAAIVWPIMRDNHLGVMTLEDFPPNREFWGRNFNAGECIQLVLKSPINGQWLPFRFICKVMLHEIAHIKHMNHSQWFHQVRIGYHKEFAVLEARGYTGDGFYGAGQSLSTALTLEREVEDEELPENLCGGAYRKAKAKASRDKPKLTYAEMQQRRKERMFGKGEGTSLGGNEKIRCALEKGKGKTSKSSTAKPRIAQSQRGRNLRAEAALKRFEADASGSKNQEEGVTELAEDSATEDESRIVQFDGGDRFVREIDGKDEQQEEWGDIRKEMRQLKLDDMTTIQAKSSGSLTRPIKGRLESLDGTLSGEWARPLA